LHRLSMILGTLAVVSGRPGEFLAERLGLEQGRESRLFAVGRTGLDEVNARGEITTDHEFDGWGEQMHELATKARAAAPLAWIEEKGVILTFHWRRAPQTEQTLRDVAAHAIEHEGLSSREGKRSIEVFPPGLPDKSTVVQELAGASRVIAYIGDDVGDLEAYQALDELDATKRTFRGCVLSDEVPSEMTRRADLLLASSTETIALLDALAEALEI